MLGSPLIQVILGFLVSAIVSGFLLMKQIPEQISRLALPQPPPPQTAEEKLNAKFTEVPPPMWNFNSEAIQELVTELRAQEEDLKSRRKDLDTSLTLITSERQEVEKVKQEIVRLRQELDAKVVEVHANEEKNLKNLAKTYEGMAPSAAALIFREMEEDTVVKVFSLMKVDKVGILLGELAKSTAGDKGAEESPAKRAARISDKLRIMKPLKKEVAQ